jgi:hypothetical protein
LWPLWAESECIHDNGHTGRYACMHMKTIYGEPFCQ